MCPFLEGDELHVAVRISPKCSALIEAPRITYTYDSVFKEIVIVGRQRAGEAFHLHWMRVKLVATRLLHADLQLHNNTLSRYFCEDHARADIMCGVSGCPSVFKCEPHAATRAYEVAPWKWVFTIGDADDVCSGGEHAFSGGKRRTIASGGDREAALNPQAGRARQGASGRRGRRRKPSRRERAGRRGPAAMGAERDNPQVATRAGDRHGAHRPHAPRPCDGQQGRGPQETTARVQR